MVTNPDRPRAKETRQSSHIRRLTQVAATTLFLLCAVGASAAYAGPAPTEPEYPPPGQGRVTAGGGFPWLLTATIVLLAVAMVALLAVLWHRAHANNRRLAIP